MYASMPPSSPVAMTSALARFTTSPCSMTSWGCPSGMPVLSADLHPHAHSRLRGAPPGVVSHASIPGLTGAGEVFVARLLKRTLCVQGVSISARHGWRQAFDRAQVFLPVAPTWLLLSSRQAVAARAATDLLEAGLAGMGVAVHPDGGGPLRWLVEPARPASRGLKAAAWRFEERALGCLFAHRCRRG